MSEYMPPQFSAMPAQAEQHVEPPSKLALFSMEMTQWIDDYTSATTARRAELRKMYEAPATQDYAAEFLARDGLYSDAELETYFSLLSQVEKVSGIDWQHQLRKIPAERLYHHFEDDFSHLHKLLVSRAQKMTRRTADHIDRVEFAEIFYRSTMGSIGEPYKWLGTNGSARPELPEYMHSFVEDPRFAFTALEMVYPPLPEETPLESTKRIRDAEQTLLERYTPIDGEIASYFRRSLDARTAKLDDDDEIIPLTDCTGGVAYGEWKAAMKAVITSTSDLMPSQVEFLYEQAGIVNFDRYSSAQLDRILKVLEGDQRTIDRLKQQDVTISLLDTYGDYNNSSMYTPAVLEKEGLLVFEVEHPSQLLRHLIRLSKRTGIRPSGIILSTHGVSGGVMAWGEGADEFTVVSDKTFAIEGLEYVDLSQAKQLGRLLRKYTQLHSKTGERLITFDSCLQGEFMYPEGITNAEAILSHTTEEDKVVVRTMSESGSIRRVPHAKRDQVFKYCLGREQFATREFRVLPAGMEPDTVYPTDYLVTERDTFRYV